MENFLMGAVIFSMASMALASHSNLEIKLPRFKRNRSK